jgi:hypothetical protein
VKECILDSIGEEKAMAILILAMNQLTGRKSLTKIGDWFRQSPLHRWIPLEPEKLTKDYFLCTGCSILPE